MKLDKQILSYVTATLIVTAGLSFAISAPATAQQATVAIDNDDIGGVVRGPGGPEAGVWVIAETTELPTKFAKIVVTDDQGRFVIPAPQSGLAADERCIRQADRPPGRLLGGPCCNRNANLTIEPDFEIM